MTKYIPQAAMDETNLLEIAISLKEGKLVVFPTDTVYGIGTNAYDGDACARIYAVKNRPSHKPLIILISKPEMLSPMVEYITPVEQKLMDTFWPGPLTLKLKQKPGALPKVIAAQDDYLRVRLVDKSVIADLITKAGVPVVAPSANLSGSPTGTKIANIVKELDGKVDYILDYGDFSSDLTSTVVAVEQETITIIREGRITKAELAKVAPVR